MSELVHHSVAEPHFALDFAQVQFDAPELLEKFFKLSYSTDPGVRATNVVAPKFNVKETVA